MDSKKVLELQRQNQTLSQHVNRLYTICSELYKEVHDLKTHTNYKEKLPTITKKVSGGNGDSQFGLNQNGSDDGPITIGKQSQQQSGARKIRTIDN